MPKTDQAKGEYVTEAEEALQTLGKGYNNDSIPPTEFISIMTGFTPAPDALIQKYGFVTALVWGRTWRYCQMSDGVCRAAINKIGESLGMSERTVIRHLDQLCKGGYLSDTTPQLRNKPHIYADTGKIKIRVNVEGAMTESHSRVTESQRHYDRESVEESIKKESKKQKKNTAKPDFKNLPPKQYRTIPELRDFMDATSWIPGSFVLEVVYDFVHAGLTKEKIASAFVEWVSRGYKPANVQGYLTWARDGIPPAYSGNKQSSKTESQSQLTPLERYAASLRGA